MATTCEASMVPRQKRIKCDPKTCGARSTLLANASSRFNDPVRIEVGFGGSRRTFLTDAAFLTTRSLFFRKALSGKWKEAEERHVRLPYDNAEIFALYMHFMRTNEFAVVPDQVPEIYKGSEETPPGFLSEVATEVFTNRHFYLNHNRTKGKAHIKSYLEK
jgi:hypothetical protein